MLKLVYEKIAFSPFAVAFIYVVFATVWILFTDYFVKSLQLSDSLYSFFQSFKGIFFVLATSLLIFIMTNRLFKIQKHLYSVLSILSDINQLIVREKDVSKLLQKSCNILASSHIYKNAWIITFDENKHVNHLVYSDNSKEFEFFKEKILTNWTPYCISKVATTDEFYSFTKNPLTECKDCPMCRINDCKSAFTIELKHKDELYGYLNIYMDKEYVNDKKELALLKELAGDISYALNNLKIEKNLAEGNRQLSAFMDNLPGMAYRCNNDSRFNMEFVSEGCLDLTNYNSSDITNNKKVSFAEIIHPDDRDRVYNDVQNGLKQRGAFESEYRIITASKNTKWVWEHGLGIYDKENNIIALEGVIIDNDARKQAEQKLVFSNHLLEQKSKELEIIFNETPDPMIIHDEDQNILMINKALEERTGYKYEDINTIDKWAKKIAPNNYENVKKYIQSLYSISKKTYDGEFEVITKSGEILIWSFSSGPLKKNSEGKLVVISSAKDITELKQKDELLMMQSRHAAMGEMIAMIAHQWRQPLSVIAMVANNMLLDIALDNFDTTKAEKISLNILDQTSHLSKTIDDFRNFFKSDKEVSKVKLQYIIEETLTIIGDSLINNSIELQTSFESDSEVDAYQRELIQVFINIINNAKDAIASNDIQKPIIKIKIYEDDKYVNTEICDNAKGIVATVLPNIFDPYFTTKDEKTGTGLGLYMSKMIIENHLKGIIEVSNKTQGACFRVRLLK